GTKVDTSANGAVSTVTDTANITVTAVNDAPVLDASKSPVLGSTAEDTAAPVGTGVGFLVSNIINSGGALNNFADVDGPGIGIAIVGVNGANGTWKYTTDNGNNWVAVGTVSDAQALLLKADVNTKLHFQPA